MKTIKSKIATVAFALAGTFTASASHAQDTTPSVVIVHGTFADGSDWANVVPLLQAQGSGRYGCAKPAHLACRRCCRDAPRLEQPAGRSVTAKPSPGWSNAKLCPARKNIALWSSLSAARP